MRARQVDDPLAWHAANLARNRRHYSVLGAAGPLAVVCLADTLGAGIHFNPFVRLGSQARYCARCIAQHTREALRAAARAWRNPCAHAFAFKVLMRFAAATPAPARLRRPSSMASSACLAYCAT